MTELSQRRFRLLPDVMARRVGEEIVFLNVQRECYYGLEEVGARMFTLLTEGLMVEDVVQRLQVEYSVEPDVLQRDIESLIGDLTRHELIQIIPPSQV